MLLAKAIATASILVGLFGLIVVSVPSNYLHMFHEPDRPFVSLIRLTHAYVSLLCIIGCGIAVWFAPAYAGKLAIVALVALVAGRVIGVLAGNGIVCVRCLFTGVLL